MTIFSYDVTVFDALITGHRDAVDPRAKFVEGNLADRELIMDVCRRGEFDAIMHFAAFSLVGESMKDPGKYFGNNLANGINLADAAIAGAVSQGAQVWDGGICARSQLISVGQNTACDALLWIQGDGVLRLHPYGKLGLPPDEAQRRRILQALEAKLSTRIVSCGKRCVVDGQTAAKRAA